MTDPSPRTTPRGWSHGEPYSDTRRFAGANASGGPESVAAALQTATSFSYLPNGNGPQRL